VPAAFIRFPKKSRKQEKVMFAGIAKVLSERIRRLSHGKLNCLPYIRSLLDCMEELGLQAKPLVVRAVVFGKVDGVDWEQMLKKVGQRKLFEEAVTSPNANGWLQLTLGPDELGKIETFKLPYRTLGYTHGNGELGSYDEKGSWSGHLVAVADGAMIDLTMAQLNEPFFNIAIKPDFMVTETDEPFLEGKQPAVFIHDGMLFMYKAFPEEGTYKTSRSFSEPGFRGELKNVGLSAARALKTVPKERWKEEGLELPESKDAPLSSEEKRKQRGDKLCHCGSGRKYKNCHGKER
jgi:hypothetical protein